MVLPAPSITESATGYIVEWGDVVRCTAKSLRQHTDGVIKAEITVDANMPGCSWVCLKKPAIINLSSDQTRERLAKALDERYGKGELDWYAIIEQMSDTVTQAYRKGEPVYELWSAGDCTPPNYIVEPYLIKDYPNVFFGDPGSFKSAFALMVSLVVALPWDDNTLNMSAPSEPLVPLYLDWETDKATIQWTMTRIQRGMNVDPFYIKYRSCALPLYQDLEQIKEAIDYHGANLLIIDSLGLASGGEPKETEPALKFFAALRQLKTTSLILGHNSKNSETNKRSIYGNMYYTAQSRNIWEVRKVAEPDENKIDIALFHRKAPPFDKLRKAQGYHVEFSRDKICVTAQEATTVREFVQGMGTQAQIKDLLLDGELSTSEIAETLDITDVNCRMALKRLRDKKEVIKLNNGKYGLLDKYRA